MADERERSADERERSADERERLADQRERLADQRDRLTDQRDRDADERERQADLRDRIADAQDHQQQDGDQERGQAPPDVAHDGEFGIYLGRVDEPTDLAEPDVAAPSPPLSHRGKSLTERLAEAADDRERARSSDEDDVQRTD